MKILFSDAQRTWLLKHLPEYIARLDKTASGIAAHFAHEQASAFVKIWPIMDDARGEPLTPNVLQEKIVQWFKNQNKGHPRMVALLKVKSEHARNAEKKNWEQQARELKKGKKVGQDPMGLKEDLQMDFSFHLLAAGPSDNGKSGEVFRIQQTALPDRISFQDFHSKYDTSIKQPWKCRLKSKTLHSLIQLNEQEEPILPIWNAAWSMQQVGDILTAYLNQKWYMSLTQLVLFYEHIRGAQEKTLTVIPFTFFDRNLIDANVSVRMKAHTHGEAAKMAALKLIKEDDRFRVWSAEGSGAPAPKDHPACTGHEDTSENNTHIPSPPLRNPTPPVLALQGTQNLTPPVSMGTSTSAQGNNMSADPSQIIALSLLTVLLPLTTLALAQTEAHSNTHVIPTLHPLVPTVSRNVVDADTPRGRTAPIQASQTRKHDSAQLDPLLKERRRKSSRLRTMLDAVASSTCLMVSKPLRPATRVMSKAVGISGKDAVMKGRGRKGRG
ncbi:hypothetical protein K439DRAFT_1610701 [Ramaria rubella]|nr:hypothetical protein K439DRAFT_1610701 [Ramaria rubella]